MAHYLLRKYLSEYKYPKEAEQDIIKTITQYRDLRPSFDPFVFTDGRKRQLVQLEGTISVNQQGNKYNIPVSIWIMNTHPYNPPMVFVKPTNTMTVNPGRYVDIMDKVDPPYIHTWSYPASNLLNLVHNLTYIFGEESPVFSKSSGQSPPQITFSSPASYSVNSGVSLEVIEEIRHLKEQRLWKICMTKEVELAFVPCGHFVCCFNCAFQLNKCPICRMKIESTLRIYMS